LIAYAEKQKLSGREGQTILIMGEGMAVVQCATECAGMAEMFGKFASSGSSTGPKPIRQGFAKYTPLLL
jgi:hypothetical protein